MQRVQPPTVLRFSVRGLLAVVVVAAVLSAVLAPLIRSLDAQRQWLLAPFSVALALGAAIQAALFVVIRRRAERRCGLRLCVLTIGPKKRAIIASASMGVGALVTIGASAVPLVVYQPVIPISPSLRFIPYLIYVITAMGGAQLTQAIIWGWWNKEFRSFEFCEFGIVKRAIQFIPWERVRVGRWDPSSGKLVVYLNRFVDVLAVPSELRACITEVLDQRVQVSDPQ